MLERYAVLFCAFLVFLCPCNVYAERVYFSSDGTKLSNTSPPDDSSKKMTIDKPLTSREKMEQAAAAAAAAGYALGQTVKVERGIIYKLAKDPKRNTYIFKLYRQVRKKKVDKPPLVLHNEKVKKDALALEKKKQDILASENEKKERERLAGLAREKKDAKNAQAVIREKERQIKADAQNARIKAEQDAIQKVEADARSEEERRKLEQAYYGQTALGRQIESRQLALCLEHRRFKRKTILKSRTITTASGTVNDTVGVEVKDIFYTDTHADMLKIRYGLSHRLELFLEAGVSYEKLSEITEMEPGYGAGFRVSLGQLDIGSNAGLSLDFSGSYIRGKVKGSFSDSLGDEYNKSIDFSEMEVCLEAGMTYSRLTIYSGLSYGMYTEDTVNEQKLVPPDFTILNDELEQQDNLMVKAGAQYRYGLELLFYLEYQTMLHEGILAGMEYRF
ncbi:MAG: hypothetical protein KKD44_13415 [Proteobacteria bacterium]|nr:hypothetical protein [Pseudomonadota bacterium]